MEDLVFYLSYGSNLDEARFLTYITGGSVPGSTKVHEGCRDKSLPRKRVHHKFGWRVRFVAYSEWWEGLAACIDEEADVSHGVAYLITREQFVDVLRQENGLPLERDVVVDWEALHARSALEVASGLAYGLLRTMGELDGVPVYTFTHTSEFMRKQQRGSRKKPERTASVAYLNVIARGLSAHLPREELCEYLRSREGIKGRWTDEALQSLVAAHYS